MKLAKKWGELRNEADTHCRMPLRVPPHLISEADPLLLNLPYWCAWDWSKEMTLKYNSDRTEGGRRVGLISHSDLRGTKEEGSSEAERISKLKRAKGQQTCSDYGSLQVWYFTQPRIIGVGCLTFTAFLKCPVSCSSPVPAPPLWNHRV